MSKRSVKVERGFYINREPQKVGDVIEVSEAFAKELISAQKVSYYEPHSAKAPDPKAKPAESKAPTESKAAVVPQKGDK